MPEQYTIKAGDHLTAIADSLGLPDTQTILAQSANDALGKRPHPDMLNPGETLTVPDLEPLKFTLATGKRHQLTVNRPKAKLCVTFATFQGKPTAATSAEVTPESKPSEKVSLDSGKLEKKIPPTCPQAQVLITSPVAGKPDIHWRLRLGHLARIEGDEGAFARLRNLGYYRAVPADTDARERRAAIEEFQFDQGLTLSGTMDDDTRAKIEEIYGC
jgi:cell division septation protein DedD